MTAPSAKSAAGGRRGEAAWLRGYDPSDYPTFTVTADLAVLTIRDGQLCALLVQRGEHPYRGWWGLPGGHVRHGEESVDDAATRELHEETGIDVTSVGLHLEQLRTYADPRRDPRIAAGLHVTSVAYVALTADLPEPAGDVKAATEIRKIITLRCRILGLFDPKPGTVFKPRIPTTVVVPPEYWHLYD